MKYPKPALGIPDQIAKMKKRGLQFADEKTAEHHLRYMGYYRLSAYALFFQEITRQGKPFRPNTTFEQILELYNFDRKLRLLTLDAIERIEVAVRSVLNNEMGLSHGPHWFMEKRFFFSPPYFDHGKFLSKLREDLTLQPDGSGKVKPRRPHHEVFINHYYAKYGEPELPPSWMTCETLSLGSLSLLYRNLQSRPARQKIASFFGVDESILYGWLHTLTYVRNLCAHHSRLWNHRLVIKFSVARHHQKIINRGDSIYAVLVVLHELLKKINPDAHWHKHLLTLMTSHPRTPLAPMGFPDCWSNEPFWGF